MRKIPLLNTLQHDQWVKPFLKQYRISLILALLLGFLTFFCGAALMFNSGYLISKSASMPSNILLVYIPIVLTRAFGIGRPVFRYLERLTSHNWVLRMTSKLRLKLYQTLEQDAIFLKRDFKLGDIMGLLSEDINHLQNLYLRTIFPTIIAWLIYIVIIIGIGFFSLWFALVMLLLFAILIFIFPLCSVLVNGVHQEKEKQLKNALYVDLTDNILGISDWIFSQRSQDYVTLHETSQNNLLMIQQKIKHFNNLRTLLFEIIFGIITTCLLIWSGSHFVGNHGGDANWIAAFVLCVFPLVEAFAGLSAASQETNIYSDSISRLNNLPTKAEEEQKELVPQAPFDLKIKDITFRYAKQDKEILKHLSLTIKQGEKLAILGQSGSGKSTLASLIRGDLSVNEGMITLAGIDVSKMTDQISSYISVIQQTPYLFNTSLLNNIRIGNEEASESEVWSVLEKVGLTDMVKQLPLGLDTMVDEAGLRFSGGERHRVALARILLQDTPIVLLDEPTVGLDPITEQALIRTFMTVLKDKTIIWITHHLKGIEQVDRVIFIENGELEMEGSPQELIKTSARYRRLKAIDDGHL